jgi:lipid-binding SYLF domain-containing protein
MSEKPNDELTGKVKEAKAEFVKQDKSVEPLFGSAAGYVIFPSVAKGALGVGAATGVGQLYQKGGDNPLGEAKVTQVTVGFQAGGQAYSELILFEDAASLDNFKKGNFEFSAQASAVAVTAGAAANAKYEKGIMILTMAKGGLMYEASVGGQKFKYQAYK